MSLRQRGPWPPVGPRLCRGIAAPLLSPACPSARCLLPSALVLWACVNLAFCSAVGVKRL